MSERLSRTKVVASAADLADQIGFSELTITRLGRHLGISPPGVYRHVADLDDLRSEISRVASQGAAAVLSTACAGLAGASALTAIANALRQWAGEHPGRYAALQVAPDPSDAQAQEAAGQVLVVIESALRAYDLAGDDLTDAIRFVRSALHGFISLEHGGGFKQPRSLDATFQRVIAGLDGALTHWAS